MTLDLGRLVSRAFSLAWHHRWLWFLGVFGGAGAGLNLGTNPASNFGSRRGTGQFAHFVTDHVALILGAAGMLTVIVLLAFVVSCVAIPASIWAALELDAGRDVRLGAAWRAGRARFWRFLRLALLKSLIGIAIISLAGVLVVLGIGAYRAGGDGVVAPLVLGGVILAFLLVAAFVIVALGLTWSDRLLVILELGAVDSIRAGWWLFKHSKLDTIVLGIVLYVVRLVTSVGIALVAGLASLPGILLVIAYFSTQQAAVGLLIAGIAWIVVLGGAVELVGAGFVGAFYQAGYAMAARDLSLNRGLRRAPA